MIKPSVLFVLVLCISGYQLLTKLHSYHYDLKRSSGYHTFLKSATAGLVLFVFFALLYAIACAFADHYGFSVSVGEWLLNKSFPSHEFSQTEGHLLEIAVWMLLLSYSLPKFVYRSDNERAEMFTNKFAKDPQSPEYTQLFFRSVEFGLPILFTMSDRKVYIGYVIEIYADDFNDINIVPIFSGYRDKDTLKLVPVTPYRDVIQDIEHTEEEQVNLEMFAVTLPIREINHAHLHDFSYYERFKERESHYEQVLRR
ncbi:hypothetical protein M5238_004664 [Vibrio vulnificus]|uniref:hypothetical protein n=1 Tax=Vibrio vulnificus TaxID=672 RepID=UPI001CDD621D|nr:hypothetical protein [Vibrio vulnificus]EGQ9275679.1 hypothetical protein [Vibrio vulnificus]EGQ9279807.1 hypothetical protein [Vibrio vulnificus]EGQ9299588.1 hypothetical protein [Vibrio vulnificus]EGQ9303847.1 hypothetical protein [Vibrio vulnificus]EJE8545832.1 hypothetical protein [Vibrio vulnificus]